jgi:peptidoglycan hydrolase-like protein with peptidoglycan-binding domain
MQTRNAILTALVILCVMTGSAAASSGVTASANAMPVMPRVGQQTTVTMQIDAGDVALGSFSGNLVYDPLLLRYESNSGILSGFQGVVNPAVPGIIRYNGVNVQGLTGKYDVLKVTFTAIKPGMAALDLSYTAMMAAVTWAKPMPVVRDGMVWVRR